MPGKRLYERGPTRDNSFNPKQSVGDSLGELLKSSEYVWSKRNRARTGDNLEKSLHDSDKAEPAKGRRGVPGDLPAKRKATRSDGSSPIKSKFE